MTFFVLEVFNGSVTIIVEGEEVVKLWLSGYLGIGEGFGTTVFVFGMLGWMAVTIITFVIVCAIIGESTWYNNMTQGYSNWRWARAEGRSERRAAHVPRTSGFWYLVGVYVDSVHKKICPLVTYDEVEDS